MMPYHFSVCFFKQKTAYEMRISDWSSDVCSSDLGLGGGPRGEGAQQHQICPSVLMRALAWISFCDSTTVEGRKRSTIERTKGRTGGDVSSTGLSPSMAWRSKVCRTALMNSCRRVGAIESWRSSPSPTIASAKACRSEEHTSELQSLIRSSYAV